MSSWLRQSRESEKAYWAFQSYLNLGSHRTLDAAFRQATQQQNGNKRASGKWTAWYSKYTWKARAEAFDDHLRGLEQQQREAEVSARAKQWIEECEALRQRELEMAEKLLAKAQEMLSYPLARTTKLQDGKTIIIEPAKWRTGNVPRLAATAMKLLHSNFEAETRELLLETGTLTDKILERIFDTLEQALPPEAYDVALDALSKLARPS